MPLRNYDIFLPAVFAKSERLGQIERNTCECRSREVIPTNRCRPRALKKLAKELNIPVIALSQLNRMVEQRKDKRPMLSDLRESGALEQDADLVIFIHRDDMYPQDLKKDRQGIAEILLSKHRNGKTGNVELAFISENARFENLSYRQ